MLSTKMNGKEDSSTRWTSTFLLRGFELSHNDTLCFTGYCLLNVY